MSVIVLTINSLLNSQENKTKNLIIFNFKTKIVIGGMPAKFIMMTTKIIKLKKLYSQVFVFLKNIISLNKRVNINNANLYANMNFNQNISLHAKVLKVQFRLKTLDTVITFFTLKHLVAINADTKVPIIKKRI